MKVLMLIIIIELTVLLLKKSSIKNVDIIEDIILDEVSILTKGATLATEII